MSAPRRRPRSRQKGSAAVEFALVVPLFLMILFGIVEYGWMFYQQSNLASAVRDGLRQGVTISQSASPDPRAMAVKVAQADLLALGIPTADATLSATYAGASPTKTMTLTVALKYRKLVGFVKTPAQLRYAMTMMLELQ
jgi:Flp pilus assembly protein TadG